MELTALILIDVQKGFDNPKWGIRNNPNAERNIEALLDHWRRYRQPVIHIQHQSTESDSPLHPGDPGCEFKSEAEPIDGEVIFTKQVNSAFIGTGLEEYLRKHCIHKIVIVGLTTDHCVSTTTRMAGNLGFSTILISDATATFNRLSLDGVNIPADEIHRVHLSSLNGEFCQVQSTDEILRTMPNSSFKTD